jgi:hypothetical protein
MHTKFYSENVKRIGNLGDLDVDKKGSIKTYLNK